MASDGTQYASYPSISLNDAERPEMPSALPSYVSEKEGGPWSARTPNGESSEALRMFHWHGLSNSIG